jgi:hypothetical protein
MLEGATNNNREIFELSSCCILYSSRGLHGSQGHFPATPSIDGGHPFAVTTLYPYFFSSDEFY